ncbi:hypothetical protein ACFVZD_47945 [Streptomyces sp. NPDC058287]|uniref:hypothetical protein n=1 Tax=Streptomyces sp. NPDC058287 TaxID=3346423 RepID=UPI0036E610CA
MACDRREFGDPAMFVDTLLAHVLGREQHITVAGAGHGSDGDTQAAQRIEDLLREWADRELLSMRMQQTERKAVALGDGVYRLAWGPRKQRVTLRAIDPGFYFPVIGEDDDGGEFPDRVRTSVRRREVSELRAKPSIDPIHGWPSGRRRTATQ